MALPENYATLLKSKDYIKKVVAYENLDDITYVIDDESKKIAESQNKAYLESLLYNKDFKVYYKLTNDSEKHYNFKYQDGLNINPDVFKPYGSCNGGGLYFCELDKLYQFESFGKNIRPIIVPSNVPYYFEKDNVHQKYKAPIIYALPMIKLGSKKSKELFKNTNVFNIDMYTKNCYYSDDIESLKDYESSKYTEYNIKNTYCCMKKLLVQKNYDLLYNLIYDRIFNLNELHQLYGKFIVHNFTDLLYECIKCGDKTFLEYMKSNFFPQLYNNTKHIESKSQPNYKEKLVDLLYDNMEEEVIESIKKMNGVISGSFILKHVANMDYTSNDIDVYIQHTMENWITFEILKDKLNMNEKKSVKAINPCSYNMHNVHAIKEIKNRRNPNLKIQVIFTCNDPSEFIQNNFDFDFCKCIYKVSSNELIMAHRSFENITVGNIEQKYLDNIGDRIDTFTNYRAVKTIERAIKYIKRGFIIENIDKFIDFIISHLF